MENLKDDILAHFSSKMAPTIIQLQQTNQATCIPTTSQAVTTLDELGEELICCCKGLHIYDVSEDMQPVHGRGIYKFLMTSRYGSF